MHTLIFRATLLLLILVLLPLCMCVCLSRSRNPGDGLDGWSGTSTGFHPFCFYSRGSLGGPTCLGRFPFPIRTGRERSFPFFSFLPLVYLIIYCRSFNESLFKLYKSHSFLTFSPLIVRLKLICPLFNEMTHQDKRITMVNNKHHWTQWL